jgi:hypothetical protein
MAKVATQTKKSNKAFYAHLYDDHGVLTMDEAGAVWFRHSETEALTLITPEMYPFVMPHGEVGLADTQLLREGDRVRECSKTLVGV